MVSGFRAQGFGFRGSELISAPRTKTGGGGWSLYLVEIATFVFGILLICRLKAHGISRSWDLGFRAEGVALGFGVGEVPLQFRIKHSLGLLCKFFLQLRG